MRLIFAAGLFKGGRARAAPIYGEFVLSHKMFQMVCQLDTKRAPYSTQQYLKVPQVPHFNNAPWDIKWYCVVPHPQILSRSVEPCPKSFLSLRKYQSTTVNIPLRRC